MIKHIKSEEFDKEVLSNKDVVIVDFYADWCGPCKMQSRVLDELTDYEIVRVNVDEHEDLAKKYGVMSIPTLIKFKNGEEVDKNTGFLNKEDLIEWINK